MLLHVDNAKFKVKPTKAEIGAIKCRFAKSANIREMTVKQVADCLIAGRTVQPGVTPFSDATKAKGYKGTSDDDFTQQTLFMSDIDNENGLRVVSEFVEVDEPTPWDAPPLTG